MASEKILVVDDDPPIVELCVALLEEEGYQVAGVTSGAEAIRRAQETAYDLVLTDILMPPPDGLSTFREIRNLNFETSGVAMTGQGSMEVAIKALNEGFSAFILKPFQAHQLLRVVQDVLEKRRLLRENARLQTLASLYRANQTITHQTTEESWATCTVKVALEQGQADTGSLMLLKGECLRIVASEGLPSDVTQTACKYLGEPIAGYVAAQGQPLLLNSQDLLSPFATWLTRPHIVSSLCLPLGARAQPLGVLNLNRLGPNTPFTSSDADRLSILTMQAGLALERLRMAEQRLQSEKLTAIGRIVSHLVHDMRAPLSVIHSAAEMLAEKDRGNHSLPRLILRETDHLMEMAQDVLDFAKGEENLQPQLCLVRDLVEEVIYTLQRQFEPDPVTVTAHIDYPGEAHLDVRKMRRALLNLGTNAREAMPEGGTIHIRVWAQPEAIMFSVSDTGCGIPPEVQGRIFEPFFTHGKKNGTGLGLPIVRSIVEGHGGTVSFHSQPGQGTTFLIHLPR